MKIALAILCSLGFYTFSCSADFDINYSVLNAKQITATDHSQVTSRALKLAIDISHQQEGWFMDQGYEFNCNDSYGRSQSRGSSGFKRFHYINSDPLQPVPKSEKTPTNKIYLCNLQWHVLASDDHQDYVPLMSIKQQQQFSLPTTLEAIKH